MNPIRILIADDHTVVRDGLEAILATEQDFAIVGKAKDGAEAVDKAVSLKPNVVLMDLRMPGVDGVEAMLRIQAQCPDTKVLVLSTYDNDEYIFQAIQAGARGYLLKDAAWEELFQAVRAAHKGESLIHPSVAAKILDRFTQMSKQSVGRYGLSEREVEVLRLMAKGASNKEISASLSISASTVKNHISNIFGKLGVNDRTQAVALALQKEIIKM
ncbi:MAG: response regulator transcription factor [Chloroflexi bacterium]|nr:response regulator transcription factor [Chloroflexota bacterium]